MLREIGMVDAQLMSFLRGKKTVSNWARDRFYNVLATNQASFCLYSENLSEVEFKGNKHLFGKGNYKTTKCSGCSMDTCIHSDLQPKK